MGGGQHSCNNLLGSCHTPGLADDAAWLSHHLGTGHSDADLPAALCGAGDDQSLSYWSSSDLVPRFINLGATCDGFLGVKPSEQVLGPLVFFF